MDEGEARRRFGQARVARLATVRADGHPHLVPLVFALAADTVYSAVDQKPKRSNALKRLANIRAHPSVSLLVDCYDDDWSSLWWVRADGTARILAPEDPEAGRALALLTARYEQYRAAPPPGPVLAMTVERWVSWSAR